MIAVLDYGIGNLRSAEKALQHVGADARLVSDPEEVQKASGVVLPGVGAFGACMRALRNSGLSEAALDAVSKSVPFLAICIGYQLLFEGSEESPETEGLGILSGAVRALAPQVKSPQMQWNRVERVPRKNSMLLDSLGARPWFYFVHSYAPEAGDDVVATCDYGGSVVAASEKASLFGVQFHPEKSGRAGLTLLANFVAVCGETRRAGAGAGAGAAAATAATAAQDSKAL